MSNLNAFDKELKVVQLYYENAEANIVNSLFLETADAGDDEESRIQKIKDKIVDTIDEIIEKIKEFFAQIQRKIESAKINAMLQSEAARSVRKIKAEVKDKEITKAISAIYKIENKSIADARKVYEQFMAHKIDYDVYCKKLNEITDNAIGAIKRVSNDMDETKVINLTSAKGQCAVHEITKRVKELFNVQTKIITKMNEEAIKEEQQLKAEARRAAVENVTAAATSKLSAFISRINKIGITDIIKVAGLAGAAATVYNIGKKNGDTVVEVVAESCEEPASAGTDDYFAGILEDGDSTFEESVEDEHFDYNDLWNND